MRLLFILLIVLNAQELRNQSKHRRHRKKELEFVQVSADLSEQHQRLMLEGIIQQVNQLALLVQRQNYFDDQMRSRPAELQSQLDALDGKKTTEELKIVQSLKQQLSIISQAMNKEDSVQECVDEVVCSSCESTVYYILDEDNWYMIGFDHGFKKEFQQLLDSAKATLGNAEIHLAFSSSNHICLEFQDMNQNVDINSVLKLYLGTTMTDYQNKLFKLPSTGIPQQFSVRAEYVNRQFMYRDLKFSVLDSQPRDIIGGRLNKLLFTIDNQNVKIQYDGQFFLQQLIYPFTFNTSKGSDQIEQINLKYSKSVAQQYVSDRILNANQKYSTMQASTIVNPTEIVFSVDFE